MMDLINNNCCVRVVKIFLNCVDPNRKKSGADTGLIGQISQNTAVPLIACDGVSSLADVKCIIKFGIIVVAGCLYFVFYDPQRIILIIYSKYENLTALPNS